MTERLQPHDPQSARTAMLDLFAIAFGTLQSARTVTDPQLADAILDSQPN